MRRDSLEGWLGGSTPEDYGRMCHSETPVMCHVHEGSRCAGMAIYRANVCQRQPAEFKLPSDKTAVFANRMEFLDHHKRVPGKRRVIDLMASVRMAAKPRPVAKKPNKPKRRRRDQPMSDKRFRIIDIGDINDWRFSRLDTGLTHLQSFIRDYDLDMNPPFQRGLVWGLRRQQDFVGDLISGMPMPPLWINEGPDGRGIDGRCHLVDGKQRIDACLRWLRAEIEASVIDRQGNTMMVNINDVDMTGARGVNLQFNIMRCSLLDSMVHYVKLNRGGVSHTDAEIEAVKRLIEKERSP